MGTDSDGIELDNPDWFLLFLGLTMLVRVKEKITVPLDIRG